MNSARTWKLARAVTLALLVVATLSYRMQSARAAGASGTVFDRSKLAYSATDVALQANGTFVTAGTATVAGYNTAVVVARYTADKTLDSSFGNGGSVTIDVTPLRDTLARVAVLPDGKIVVGGNANFDGYSARGGEVLLLRFNANGSLDQSFGNGGIVRTDLEPGSDLNDNLTDLTVQPDGKIVASAYSLRREGTTRFTVLRYNTDGSLDTSLAGDGVIDDAPNGAYALALQPDGKIVAGGNSGKDVLLYRYLPDGRPDPAFGNNGRVDTPFVIPSDGSVQGSVRALLVQPDGKIIAAGDRYSLSNFSNRFFVLRYSAAGQLDPSFDGDGGVFAPSTLPPTIVNRARLQSDGRILIGGAYNYVTPFDPSRDEDVYVARLDTNGSLDAGFGNKGIAVTDLAPRNRTDKDSLGGLALQADGKIVVSGESYNQTTGASTPYIVRYVP